MSDAVRITLSVFGSALTVAVALAALILASANETRRQFDEQNELMRKHFSEQIEHLREDLREVRGEVREVRGELLEVRGEIRAVRGEIREIRGEVHTLGERQAKVEGLLSAAREPTLVPSPVARGTGTAASRAGESGPD